jgi:hypothetical protein
MTGVGDGAAQVPEDSPLKGLQSDISGDVAPVCPVNAAEPTKRIPEFESALERAAASFTQLGTAIFFSGDKFNASPVGRSAYARYIAPLTEAFEKAHGHITHSFYCQNIISAAVLTDRNELWIIHPPIDVNVLPIADLLFECDRINVEADRILGGAGRLSDLQATKILIYSVVVKLLTLIDGPTPPLSRNILDLHWREVKHAHDYYLRAAERYAKFDYFRGMLIGILVCLVLIAVSATIWWQFGFDLDIGRALIGCLTAGGIGAVVSVMSRMTFGELSLDYEAGRRLLTMFGGFRPVIGMAFGAAMLVLYESGILSIGPIGDQTKTKQLFFFTLISFLAGFSERWAQDMLGRTADQLSVRDESENKPKANRPTNRGPRHMRERP